MTDLFNWRPFATAPRDGSELVAMQIVTHVGGWSRPISITPDLELVKRAHMTADSPGYWSIADQDTSFHPNEISALWTTPDEFAAVIARATPWRTAPKDAPLVFVRPDRQVDRPWHDARYVHRAIVAWPDGPKPGDQWTSVQSCPTKLIGSFLDGYGGEGPFVWLLLSEFFPQHVFDDMHSRVQIASIHDTDRIRSWRHQVRS